MMFTPTEKELVSIREWQAAHEEHCRFVSRDPSKNLMGANGGTFTYSFTPTGIGQAVTVSCSCGAEKNVTDYDMW